MLAFITEILGMKKALDAKGAPLDDRALVLIAVLGNVLPQTIETLGNDVVQEVQLDEFTADVCHYLSMYCKCVLS